MNLSAQFKYKDHVAIVNGGKWVTFLTIAGNGWQVSRLKNYINF